jgi:hypothetical protein
MWNPFKARRDHELKLAQIQADQQRYLADALREISTHQSKALENVGSMVAALAEGQSKQSDILKTWLDSFKVIDPPQSTVVRDEDEVLDSVRRAMNEESLIPPEMPEGLPAEFQLAWLLRKGEQSSD